MQHELLPNRTLLHVPVNYILHPIKFVVVTKPCWQYIVQSLELMFSDLISFSEKRKKLLAKGRNTEYCTLCIC